MNQQKLKLGSVLIAKDDLYMMGTNTIALLKDKKYQIIEITKIGVFIKSEIDNNHLFSFDILTSLFYLKEEKELEQVIIQMIYSKVQELCQKNKMKF